MSNTRNIN